MAGEGMSSVEDYKDTPQGQYKRWDEEIRAAEKRLRKWRKQANKVVKRYIDERDSSNTDNFRLNLFHSNITTIKSMLYGNAPRAVVKRTNDDSKDDVARVASAMLERVINADVEENGEEWDSVLHSVLEDRLIPGLGVARARYEMETDERPVVDEVTGQPILDEEGEPLMEEFVDHERVCQDYFYWEDVLWSWARTWSDVSWVAFRSWLTKDQIKERFPDIKETTLSQLTFKNQMLSEEGEENDGDSKSAWMVAGVWEIWCKTTAKVYWYSPGCNKTLSSQDDPLGLNGFYPCPPFLLANPTTRQLIPTPDFHIAQDLYNEIDYLQGRIAAITRAVRVVGVYDGSAKEVGRMLKEGVDNDLIPVESWARFSERGGLKGSVDWFPILEVVNALDKLTQKRDETVSLLYQVTGLSDILRGAATQSSGRVSATEQELKGRFGSIRMQALQDQFARFCGDLMQIKAEIVARHFEPEEILRKANMQHSHDAELAPAAVQFLQEDPSFQFRVQVKPETVAMMDFAALKQERTEFISSLAVFLQSAAPIAEMDPGAVPPLLSLLQWGLAGFKGSNEIEGVIDKAIEQLEENLSKGGQEKDPEAEKERIEREFDLKLEQSKTENAIRVEAAQSRFKIQEERVKTEEVIKRERIKTQEEAKRQRIRTDAQMDSGSGNS